jgi:hypothetical protein
LIERLSTACTALASRVADWAGPPVSHSNRPFPQRRVGSGPARRLAAWLGQIRPGSVFFFRNLFKFDLICDMVKFIEYSLYEQINWFKFLCKSCCDIFQMA